MYEAQESLAAAALERIERCQAVPGRGGDVVVVTVICDLDAERFLHGTLEFAGRIPVRLRQPWYRAFTKTLFFAGNPRHLGLPYEHVTDDGAIAWLGPVGRRHFRGLSRLLRLFHGPGPIPGLPGTLALTVPGGPHTGRSATLLIATAGVGAADYLVHVHHVVCEAVIRGLIGPGDLLRVRHVDELEPRPGPAQELRIAQDTRNPGRLRLYACLTAEEEESSCAMRNIASAS